MEQTNHCDREIAGKIELGREIAVILSQGDLQVGEIDEGLLKTLGETVEEIYRRERIKGLAVGTY